MIDPRKAELAAADHGYFAMTLGARELKYMRSFKKGRLRVNVYFTTGTVGTSLYHPEQDRRTQLFRRNMTLSDLKKILAEPRLHTGRGYYDRLGREGRKVRNNTGGGWVRFASQFGDKETWKRAMVPNYYKGKIKSITIGLNTFVALFTDGTTRFGPNLPKELFHKLFRRSSRLPPPDIVELGLRSDQSYFVQFADGSKKWHDLPDKLEKILEKDTVGVDVLAIGSRNHFYVRLKDGTVHYYLPADLSGFIKSRVASYGRNPDHAEIVRVSLSESGDWAVQLTNGRWRWNEQNNNIIQEEHREKIDNCWRIRNIAFGGGEDYIVSYIE